MKYKFLAKPMADKTVALSATKRRNRSGVCANPVPHPAHDACPGRLRSAKTERPVDPVIAAELNRALNMGHWVYADRDVLGLIPDTEQAAYDLQSYEGVDLTQRQKYASFFTIVARVNDIIRDYASQSLLPLTLRQIHYQLVVRHKDYPNTKTSYDHTCEDIGDARMWGLVPWDAIDDPTRDIHAFLSWKNPQARLESAAANYRIDRWAEQDHRPIVLVEKDAALGTISNVCDAYDVPHLSCKGYGSLSALHGKVAEHCRKAIAADNIPVVIHLSDHDATGADMERNLSRRLTLFVGEVVDIRHIALTLSQIDEYELPSDPVKSTDPRAGKYLEMLSEKGKKEGAGEMDALSPTILRDLIEAEINSIRDKNRWDEIDARQARDKDLLQQVPKHWADVQSFLRESSMHTFQSFKDGI